MRVGRAVLCVFVASLLASTPAIAQAQAPPAYDAPPPPPPPGAVPAVPQSPSRRGIFVELRASSPNVRIERLVGQLRVPVCNVPCRQILPLDEVYVIGGDGVRSTSQFTLPEDRPQVTLDVHAGSTATLAGGAGLILVGVVAAYVGYFLFLVGGGFDQIDNANNGGRSTGSATAGIVIGLGGLALAGVGVLIALDARTKVSTSTGSTFTDAPLRSRKRPALALTPRGLEF